MSACKEWTASASLALPPSYPCLALLVALSGPPLCKCGSHTTTVCQQTMKGRRCLMAGASALRWWALLDRGCGGHCWIAAVVVPGWPALTATRRSGWLRGKDGSGWACELPGPAGSSRLGVQHMQFKPNSITNNLTCQPIGFCRRWPAACRPPLQLPPSAGVAWLPTEEPCRRATGRGACWPMQTRFQAPEGGDLDRTFGPSSRPSSFAATRCPFAVSVHRLPWWS